MRALKLYGMGLLLVAGAAQAELTSTVTITNDYDFRGITQSAKDPALQASLDWAGESGFYAGAWASNVDFDSESDIETDFYVGIGGGAEEGLGWDVGLVYYKYWPDDDDIDFAEIYGELTYGVGAVKLWYADDFGNSGESAIYIEGNLAFDLPQEFVLTLHAGHSSGDFWDSLSDGLGTGDDAEYIDYSIGISKTVGHFDLGLKYIDTDTDDAFVVEDDVLNNEGRVQFTVSTTFPWSNE